MSMSRLVYSKSEATRIGFLCSVSFLAEGANILLCISLVYYLKQRFLLDASQIGIALALITSFYTASCFFLERLYEKLRPSVCLALAFLVEAGSILLVYMTSSISLVYASLALYGAGKSLLWPQLTGWMNRGLEGSRLNKATGLFNLSWCIGSSIAPTIAGMMVMRSVSLPLAWVLIINTLLLLMIIVFPQGRTVSSDSQEEKKAHAEDHSTSLRFLAWAGLFVSYIIRGPMESVFPLFAKEYLGLAESTAGLMLSLRAIVTTAALVFMSRTSFWQFSLPVLLISQALLAVLVLIASLVKGTAFFWAFFAMLGICMGFLYNLSLFHALSGTIHKSRRMMIHEAVLTAGSVVGTTAGGWIYQAIEWTGLLAILSRIAFAVLALELVGIVIMKRRRSPRQRIAL